MNTFMQLTDSQIGDICTALGQFERTVRALADAQESIANSKPTADERRKITETSRRNRGAAEEIFRTKQLLRSATRVELELKES